MAYRVTNQNRSEAISNGLGAARAIAIIRRGTGTVGQPEERDRVQLEAVRDGLNRALAAARYAPGRERSIAHGRKHLASTGIAILSAARSAGSAGEQSVDLSDHLESVVADLDRVIAGEEPDNRDALVAFLEDVVSATRRTVRQAGETVVRPSREPVE